MYDLIIIGGGPSGASAGRLAGKNGLNTLILEKTKFPRYKPCGGALSEQAMSYLDFEIPNSLFEKNVYGARVHYKDYVIEQKKRYRIATLITRSEFDHFLLKKAQEVSVKVKYDEKAIDFNENEDSVEVVTLKSKYRTKYLIIAEGSSGKLKYKIRGKDKLNEFAVCAVTEIYRKNDEIDSYIYDLIDIHFGVAKLGYGWIFPHNEYFSIGIGGIAKDIKNPKTHLINFMKKNNILDFDISNIKVHTIPAGGIKRTTISKRVVLVGDAGGHVDSFYGEGIAYAIRSGQLAVEAILKNINNRNISLKLYEHLCEKNFGDNLKYSLILSKIMHSIPDIFFKVFTSNDKILNRYLEVPALKLTYKRYLQWLLPRVPLYLFANKINANKSLNRNLPRPPKGQAGRDSFLGKDFRLGEDR